MISRRSLLGLAVAGGAGLAGLRHAWLPELSGLRLGGGRVVLFEDGNGARLLDFLKPLEALAPVGNAWLDSLEESPDLVFLMQSLSTDPAPGEGGLEQALAGQIRRDFVQGDVCDVSGWQLSLTECRLGAVRQLAADQGLITLENTGRPATATGIDSYTLGELAPVTNWGPRKTLQGRTFNEQLDGHSGLWFKVQGAPGHARIAIDGEMLDTRVRDKLVVTGLRGDTQARILANPGRYAVDLVDPIRKIRQPIGEFLVKRDPSIPAPSPDSEIPFCQVVKWGPQKTRAGVAANEQPDGAMGIWIHTDCLPQNAQVYFADDILPSARRPFGLTAKIPLALLGAPGSVPLSLHNPDTGEKLLIGRVTIE